MNKKSSQSIVVVKNLKKSYDGQTVVNDISFSVKKGEVFGILGPNGAGKTTTLEMLEALRPIDSGNATINLEDKKNSYVENLSGGQKQRFSIAAALVHNPIVFFLDEPTTGLDPQARRNLWQLVRKVRDNGVTVIITTHYMDEAQMLCDRVAVMDEGSIVALDTPKQLIKQLLSRGFTKQQKAEQANLEDVFIDLTGKELRG